ERRADLLEAALAVFASTSYAGATTAEIARSAGVSEPILYRHFTSKKALYVACLDLSWQRLHETWSYAREGAPGPEAWLAVTADATFALVDRGTVIPPTLWMQAFSEAGDDPEIRAAVRRVVADVHRVIRETLHDLQEAGVVRPERDADAEAWITVAGLFFRTFVARVGGIGSETRSRVQAERLAWLTGVDPRTPP
ncbi:MAG: TetR/AcrR family transcriptional regulator, partial [Actinobacteria bacterium]|nr:TetR/AcrR family transcriptional regulator [Actinomycetota bacterium]